MAKTRAAAPRHARVFETPRECYPPATNHLRALSLVELDTIVAVRSFARDVRERELEANAPFQKALERIRMTSLASCSADDRDAFLRGLGHAEAAGRHQAAERFGISVWKVIEMEETLIPGDARVRPAQREEEDPDFWQHVNDAGAQGAFKVQPDDVADTPLGQERRARLKEQDAHAIEAMVRRRDFAAAREALAAVGQRLRVVTAGRPPTGNSEAARVAYQQARARGEKTEAAIAAAEAAGGLKRSRVYELKKKKGWDRS